MIALRVAHLIPTLRPSSAFGSCLSLSSWLRDAGHSSLMVSAGGPSLAAAEQASDQVIIYDDTASSLLHRGRRKVINQLLQWECDLVHAHHIDALPLAFAIADKLSLPVVASIHSSPKAKTVELLKSRHLRIVLVPSEALRAHCCGRLGLSPDRVVVVPYAVNCQEYSSQPASADEPLTIGMVGNTDDEGAGFAELLVALQALQNAQIPFTARLLCRGGGIAQLRRQAEQAKLSESTTVTEVGARLSEELNDIGVFVYPVHMDHNILCLAKAMAASCAVVASAVGGVHELVHDEHNGLLVPPGNATALSESLMRLAQNRQLSVELATEARVTIEQECAVAMVGPMVHELYRLALHGGSVARSSTEVKKIRRSTSQFATDQRAAP